MMKVSPYYCVKQTRFKFERYICAGAVVNLEAIADVVEGESLTVCVNLICSGSTLGCPLNVLLNVSDNTKTG